MKKSAVAAFVVLIGVGGAAFWHHNGHPGLEHGHGHDEHAEADHAGHGDHADHHDHGGGGAKLELNDGKKWATDEPLRAGMSQMHEAVKPALKAYQARALTPEDAKKLGGTIRHEVNGLIENCSLEPKADAVLHIVIAQLLGAASAVEKDPAGEAGVPRIVAALHDYEKHFEHPGF